AARHRATGGVLAHQHILVLKEDAEVRAPHQPEVAARLKMRLKVLQPDQPTLPRLFQHLIPRLTHADARMSQRDERAVPLLLDIHRDMRRAGLAQPLPDDRDMMGTVKHNYEATR